MTISLTGSMPITPQQCGAMTRDAYGSAGGVSVQDMGLVASPVATSGASVQTSSYVPSAAAGYRTGFSVPATYGYGSATSTSGTANNPASALAPRTANDYWSKHIAQYSGKYLPDGPTMRPNCGPASTTMALRMIGLDIPGFSGQNSEAVLDRARYIATGSNDYSQGIDASHLERIVQAAGGRTQESTNLQQMLGWVQQGVPVVMLGNPSKGWDSRYDNKDVQHFDGAHWVTVSGYDRTTGFYIVNDPLSQIGPIEVSAQELQRYLAGEAGVGFAVTR